MQFARVYVLLALHMLGDYVLQTDFLAQTKKASWWSLLAHCLTYSLPFAVVFGVDWRVGALVATHFAIDALKSRYEVIDYRQDQVCHLLALLMYMA